MRFPPGPLGTDADLLIDLVVVALVVIVPVLAWSFRRVRSRDYAAHRYIQTALTVVLVGVVALFEADIQSQGGIHAIAGDAPWVATPYFDVLFSVHLIVAGSTALTWLGLCVWSWRVFPSPPTPGPSSRLHRRLGWAGAVGMVLTGLTGVAIYLMVFVL